MQSGGDSVVLCVLWCLPDCRIYGILQTQKPLAVHGYMERAKNDFGTIHRTPLAPASCFTAQFTSTAQWVAVAMNHCFPATAPSALGLCQAHSVSLPVSLFLSSTSAMARKESHGSCVLNDKTIHQTERTCLCQVKHHLNLLVMLNGRWGERGCTC